MAANLTDVIDRISAKLTELAERYSLLLQANEQLKAENNELKDDIRELTKAVERLETDKKFLTVSHRLADTPEAVVEARAVVAALIRDIDKCISQLKE